MKKGLCLEINIKLCGAEVRKISEYKNLNQRLHSEGYEIVGVYLGSTLPEGLTKLSLDIARGKYQCLKIVPADLAMQGSDWTPVEQCHVVYAMPSETEKKDREGKGITAILTAILCKHKDGGDEEYVPIHV
ncbi:hypothetical protein HY494_00845 [Candidatus Woesearchaeota archaeon]|nr:hypothetical protein [Candidatus Woesearchaeota archaeon]